MVFLNFFHYNDFDKAGDIMHINRLSLVHSLTSVINDSPQDDVNYTLAYYFLQHYHELDELNIYDVAAQCYVSRSSVRRFCKEIGYENFKDLKHNFKEFDEQFHQLLSNNDQENYREWLTNEINSMMKELDQRMNTNEVDVIIDKIHDSREVVFLTSGSSTMPVKEFQRSMIVCGKIIRIISDANVDYVIDSLTEQDYLITVSATGHFAKEVKAVVEKSKAYNVLITANRSQELKKPYHKVYHLSAKDYAMQKSVYGKYGISYMLDILFSIYVKKYGEKVK